MLVGTLDNPLYEAHLTSTKSAPSTVMSVPPVQPAPPTTNSFSIFGALQPGTASAAATPNVGQPGGSSNVGYGSKNGTMGRHVMQLVAHSSLDVVEDVQWTNGAM